MTLADLDVVKPYFRSRAARAILDEPGIRLLAPAGENVHADLPIIVPQIRAALRDPSCRLVMDVGGDDTGARVLGSLSDVVPAGPRPTACVVLNFRRPSTPDIRGEAVAMVRAIETVARVRGHRARLQHPPDGGRPRPRSCSRAIEMAVETGREPRDPGAWRSTADRGCGRRLAGDDLGCPLVVLRRIVLPPFEQPPSTRTTGPLFVVN